MIKLIVAIDESNLIGAGDKLPWHIPEEFKHFKKTTLNSTLLMGKNTFLGLPQKLENRRCFVLSETFIPEADKTIRNEDQLLDVLGHFVSSDETLFIAGGKNIYENYYKHAEVLIISRIHGIHEGNVYLNLDLSNYTRINVERHQEFDVEYWIKSKKDRL